MSKNKSPKIPKKNEVSLVRSSAAEYLTFIASSGTGGVQDRLFESDFDKMIRQLGAEN